MLLLVVLWPLIACLYIYYLKNNYKMLIGLWSNLLLLIGLIILYFLYDWYEGGYQFIVDIPLYFYNLSLGVDEVSIVYLLLTNIVITISILVSWSIINVFTEKFVTCLLFMEFILFMCFLSIYFFWFFIFFEFSLIPVFFIIGIWGIREEKIVASLVMFVYTFFSGLLLLLSILGLNLDFHNLRMDWVYDLEGYTYNYIFLGVLLSMAVKLPLWGLHSWLPLAHVEAPIGGSILLAGILLKLAGYGLYRINFYIFFEEWSYFSIIVMLWGVISLVIGSILTVLQIDMKKWIAYSSISHMGVVILSFSILNVNSFQIGLYVMISHALISSGFFYLVSIIYERVHSRLMYYWSGIGLFLPYWTIFFYFFVLFNLGFPLSSHFIGELLVYFMVCLEYNALLLVLMISFIFTTIYTIQVSSWIVKGNVNNWLMYNLRDITRKDFHTLSFLVLLIILLGLFPGFILLSY